MVPTTSFTQNAPESDFVRLTTSNLQQIVAEVSKDMGKRFSLAGLGVAVASAAFSGVVEPEALSGAEFAGRMMVYSGGIAGILYQSVGFLADWQRRDMASAVLKKRGEGKRFYHAFIVNPEDADPKVLRTKFFTTIYGVETDKVAEIIVLEGKYKGLFSKRRGGCSFTSRENFVQTIQEEVNKAVETGHMLFENEPARRQRHITARLEEFAKEENLGMAASLYIPSRLFEPRSYLPSTEVRSYEPKGIEKYVLA